MIIRFLGYLFSAAALTVLLGGALVVGAFIYHSRDLPPTEQLADYKPPQSSLVLNDDGGVIARFAREERVFIPIGDIPEVVRHAFISAEDKNFYEHRGIDPIGIGKAMVRNVDAFLNGRRLSGASTITQQVVKNTVLTNERSIARKIREAILALQIERDLDKDRILELYLNQIYLGARSYGVGAAARAYFDKPLEYVTIEEAAFLAALPKAPSALHPIRNRKEAVGRRNYVLSEMRENGFLDETIAQEATAKPLTTILGRKRQERATGPNYDWSSSYMVEEVRAKLLDWYGSQIDEPNESERLSEAESALYGGGLRIRTTLDSEMQSFAAGALRHGLHNYERTRGYRGPLGKIAIDEDWEESLSNEYYPRDLGDWRIGAILEIDDEEGIATAGVEGLDKTVSISLDAVRWARLRKASGGLGPKIQKISDVFIPGDVVYLVSGEDIENGDVVVKPLGERDEDAEPIWGLRQLPEANGAVVAMEIETGRVLAMQGGFSAQQSAFNRVTQADRQPGSSFKPIVYAAALDHGYTPATIVLDAPITVDQGNGEGLWKPKNYDEGKFYGPTPFRFGVEKSVNLMTVRIAQNVGMDVISDYAHRLGVYDDLPPFLSYSLGAGETTLMRMATAYATLANDGKRVTPRFVESIADDAGERIDMSAPWAVSSTATPAEQVIDPVTAFQSVSIMEGVVQRGTATRLTQLGFPVAGKTGTTNDARDAWFVGFTPEILFGCYIGFDNPRSLGKRASGGGLCGPVFHRFMAEAMIDRIPLKFTPPDDVELIKINRFSGERVGEDVFGRDVIWEVFRNGTGPAATSSEPSDFDSDFGGLGGDFGVSSFSQQPLQDGDPSGAAAGGGIDLYGNLPEANQGVSPSSVAPPPVAIASVPIPTEEIEPLIRFDPATGQIIVADDPAIRLEGVPDARYEPVPQSSQANTLIIQPVEQPVPGTLDDGSDALNGGRGLY